MQWLGWNATEFLLLPIIAFPYLYFYLEYGGAAALFGGSILTLIGAFTAFYRSRMLLKKTRNHKGENLEPVWPAFVGLLLLFFAVLQIILATTHLSYFRERDLIELF